MIESLMLIEGRSVQEDALRISLMNAKELIIGNAPGFGVVLHVAANSLEDFGKALLEFAKVQGVTGVVTLFLRNPQ